MQLKKHAIFIAIVLASQASPGAPAHSTGELLHDVKERIGVKSANR